jgi:hypothetical protein
MKGFCYEFQIDNRPILTPDADIKVEYTDLDSEESGRDENGFMHRIVLRHGVKTFSVSYASLTRDEYRYMESLFAGKSQFEFKYRNEDGSPCAITAYRSKHSITVRNLRTGTYKNYAFNIIEC